MTYLRTALRTLILVALGAPLLSTAVQAEGQCARRDNIVRGLIETYDEEQLGIGMTGRLLLELWSSREPPYTWTILKTYPNGVSCIVAVGKNGHWKDNNPQATPTSFGKDIP